VNLNKRKYIKIYGYYRLTMSLLDHFTTQSSISLSSFNSWLYIIKSNCILLLLNFKYAHQIIQIVASYLKALSTMIYDLHDKNHEIHIIVVRLHRSPNKRKLEHSRRKNKDINQTQNIESNNRNYVTTFIFSLNTWKTLRIMKKTI